MQYNYMSLGQRLKRCLSEKSITQKQLSEILDIPQGTISTYFRDRNEPDIKTMIKLADSLDTTVEYLITGKKVSPSSLIGELAATLEDEKLRTAYEKLILLDDDNLELATEQLDAILKRQDKKHP